MNYFKNCGIKLTNQEKENIEIVDFGLGNFSRIGLSILTYINTQRCCAKELVLLPHQTCPEHIHPDIDGIPGKEETFRCRRGTVYLYVSGEPTPNPKCKPPYEDRNAFTVFHEIILKPGQQYTLSPNSKHWFQAGPEGAVISEFSTCSRDEADIFSDPQIIRVPVYD